MAVVDPAADLAALKLAAQRALGIADDIKNKIAEIQRTTEAPSDWSGRTRTAVLVQVDDQRPVLTRLAELVDQGSVALQNLGYSFTDADDTASTAMQAAAPTASAPAPAPATNSISAEINYSA